MTVWMKIDETALDDWRISALARKAGISYGDALLLCLRVWRRLYNRGGGVMARMEIDAASNRDGMAQWMVECSLADESPDGFRLKGDDRANGMASFVALQSEKGKRSRKGKGDDEESAPVQPGIDPGLTPVQPGISKSKSRSSSLSGSGSPEAREVAVYLLEAIRSHKPDATDRSDGWVKAIDKAIRLDGRTPERLKAAIDFAHRSSNTFWRGNLLSGQSLRDQCERLEIQAASSRASPVRDVRVGHVAVTGNEKYSGGEVKL